MDKDKRELEMGIDQDILDDAKKFDPSFVRENRNFNRMNKEIVNKVLTLLAKAKGIETRTVVNALNALLRKGAANAGAPDTMAIDVVCPRKNVCVSISKYDMKQALKAVTGHTNVRKLAEFMARALIELSLAQLKTNPSADQKGDLADRLDKKLINNQEPPLTRKEAICANTYMQHLDNLDELAESNRLKRLLEEDLLHRSKSPRKRRNMNN